MKRFLSILFLLLPVLAIAQTKISELPAASAPSASDLAPIVQGGTTKKLPLGQLILSSSGKGTNANFFGKFTVGYDINPAYHDSQIVICPQVVVVNGSGLGLVSTNSDFGAGIEANNYVNGYSYTLAVNAGSADPAWTNRVFLDLFNVDPTQPMPGFVLSQNGDGVVHPRFDVTTNAVKILAFLKTGTGKTLLCLDNVNGPLDLTSHSTNAFFMTGTYTASGTVVATVTGSSSKFTTEIPVSSILYDSNSVPALVTAVSSDTSLTAVSLVAGSTFGTPGGKFSVQRPSFRSDGLGSGIGVQVDSAGQLVASHSIYGGNQTTMIMVGPNNHVWMFRTLDTIISLFNHQKNANVISVSTNATAGLTITSGNLLSADSGFALGGVAGMTTNIDVIIAGNKTNRLMMAAGIITNVIPQ